MFVRGFEEVTESHRKFPESATFLPRRADKRSAGYDFFAKESISIQPYEKHVFWTDVKAYMLEDEVLKVYVRSSLGIKYGVRLVNQTGIIDASYYSNTSNDGNIGICLQNHSEAAVVINAGDRIAQGIFSKYLEADDDMTLASERAGGFGSSGK